MISILINAIKIIFLLGFLILIHEGGHFLVAKFFKVKVNEFSIGFGKKILSKKKGETTYSLRIVPLGGYVSMLGEEERSDDERSFSKQSIPKRIAIVAAGGLVNILFGLLIYFIILFIMGNFSSRTVDSVVENYGAENAGILAGDEIVSINNKHVFISKDVNNQLQKSGNKEINVVVRRNNKKIEIKVNPTEVKTRTLGVYLDSDDENKTRVTYIFEDSIVKDILRKGDIIVTINGINVENNREKLTDEINNSQGEISIRYKSGNEEKEAVVTPNEISTYYLGIVFKKADKSFGNRLYYSWFETGNFMLSLADNVKDLFSAKVSVDQMMGPIGISKTVAKTNSFYEFIYLMALISISLGITNLLPIPALDGGKILILLIEAIRRKPMKQEIELMIQFVGFALLIGLSIYIGILDVARFF